MLITIGTWFESLKRAVLFWVMLKLKSTITAMINCFICLMVMLTDITWNVN